MNAYQERFKQHPLQGALEGLRNAIERTKLVDPLTETAAVSVEPAEVQRTAFARLFLVANFISNSIERSDASIWTLSAMNTAQTAVRALTAAIEQYEASKSVANFETAIDTALDHFGNVPCPGKVATPQDMEDGFVHFCERAEAGIGNIEALGRAIKDKELEITTAREGFAAKLAELGAQLDGFRTQFEQQKARVDELVASQGQVFQATQTERATAYAQETETRKVSYTQETEARKVTFDQWSKDSSERLEVVLTNAKSDAAANLAAMNKHLERASEILGIVAASGVSGHYKETAERDFESANIYRRWAFILFLIMAGVITYVVFSIKSDSFRWEMGLFRVGVGMALLIPAYYCAKESNKHREAEKRNRRLQIELATIEPYLEKLNSDSEMREILKKKAESYFIGQVHKEPNDDVDAQLTAKELRRREDQLMEILKSIATGIRK
jgi:hypothetical protein